MNFLKLKNINNRNFGNTLLHKDWVESQNVDGMLENFNDSILEVLNDIAPEMKLYRKRSCEFGVQKTCFN